MADCLRAGPGVFERNGRAARGRFFTWTAALMQVAEDVGRHNAVDKVVGRMVMREALPLSDRVLFVSGRTSFEIVQKAFLAGIPIVASVSAPSSLAIDLAAEAGVTLVGFVRGEASTSTRTHRACSSWSRRVLACMPRRYVSSDRMFGLGQQKPHHYREMAKIAWENRDELPFAWRILQRRRVRRLRARHVGPFGLDARRHASLHGAPRADAAEHGAGARSGDCSPTCRRWRRRTSQELRALGRLPEPMLRRRGEPGFRVVTGTRRSTGSPRSFAPPIPRASRSTSRRAASPTRSTTRRRRRRASSAPTTSTTPRACATPRRPSAMKATLGYGASTCSYSRLAARRSDRALRVERRQQPAGDDEVSARREEERRADRRREPVPRARPRALLGAVDSRRARSSARRSPTTGSTSTPAAISRF